MMKLTSTGRNNEPDHAAERNLVGSVNSTGESAQRFWLILLSVATYFLITLSGISHRDLLLETPATLPLLGISVPVVGLAVVGPPIVLAAHLFCLLHHEALFRKLASLYSKIGKERVSPEMSGAWGEINPYFYTMIYVPGRWRPLPAAMYRLIAFLTVVVFPVLLLSFFQISFLPYHSTEIVWLHRAILFADVLVLLFGSPSLWAYSLEPETGGWWPLRKSVVCRTFISALTKVVLIFLCIFSLCIATVPDELVDRHLVAMWPAQVPLYEPTGRGADVLSRMRKRFVFYPTAFVFERYLDIGRGERPGLFGWSRNLVVGGGSISGADFQGRNLRFAHFYDVQFDDVSFRSSDLTGARFSGARGTETDFSYSTMRAGEIIGSSFPDANFTSAKLDRLIVIWSHLEAAKFDKSSMAIAEIDNSYLDAASFSEANLEGAFFYRNIARSVDFSRACIQATRFEASKNNFRGSSFRGAVIWGIPFPDEESVEFADFREIQLSPVGEEQRKRLQELETFLQFVVIPRPANDRVDSLLGKGSEAWENSAEHADWEKILSKAELPGAHEAVRSKRQLIAEYLMCNDSDRQVPVATALIKRVLDLEFDDINVRGFQSALSTTSCHSLTNVPEGLKARLQTRADLGLAKGMADLPKTPSMRPEVVRTVRVSGCNS